MDAWIFDIILATSRLEQKRKIHCDVMQMSTAKIKRPNRGRKEERMKKIRTGHVCSSKKFPTCPDMTTVCQPGLRKAS